MQIFCWWLTWPELEQLHNCKQVQSENTVQDIWKASSQDSEPSAVFQPFSLQQKDNKFNFLLQNSEQTGGALIKFTVRLFEKRSVATGSVFKLYD